MKEGKSSIITIIMTMTMIAIVIISIMSSFNILRQPHFLLFA